MHFSLAAVGSSRPSLSSCTTVPSAVCLARSRISGGQARSRLGVTEAPTFFPAIFKGWPALSPIQGESPPHARTLPVLRAV
jgi:hypothetical protein